MGNLWKICVRLYDYMYGLDLGIFVSKYAYKCLDMIECQFIWILGLMIKTHLNTKMYFYRFIDNSQNHIIISIC